MSKSVPNSPCAQLNILDIPRDGANHSIVRLQPLMMTSMSPPARPRDMPASPGLGLNLFTPLRDRAVSESLLPPSNLPPCQRDRLMVLGSPTAVATGGGGGGEKPVVRMVLQRKNSRKFLNAVDAR
jgi:hypothetical protein